MISPPRRNLLIVLSFFWLLISWLVASLRPGADWVVIFMETLQIFIPGVLLLALVTSIEMMRAEKHTVVIRTDSFGGTDTFNNKRFLFIPLFYRIVARMPHGLLRFETRVKLIDTRTPRLAAIPEANVRCIYQISDYKVCLAQADYHEDRVKMIEQEHGLKPADPGMWPLLLEDVIGRLIDDNLRSTVWAWQKLVESDPSQRYEPFSAYVPRAAMPQGPTPPPLPMVLENDPYDLSLNRENLSKVLARVLARDVKEWGVTIKQIVIEQVVVSDELIKVRTRNKDGELAEAKHQAQLDYITVKGRGLAEAEIRARTVSRILQELVSQKGLPPISEKTIADIVRSAMYSDGEMIWKGVLEKSSGPPAAVTEKSGTPVRTA